MNNLRLSDTGLSFIARWEGFIGHVYNDVGGKATVGYGHLVLPGEHFTTLTQAQGLDLLRQDVGKAEHAVNSLVNVPLVQRQFDALVSFVFNVGSGINGFAGSTLLRLLNRGDYSGAASQFTLWDHVGGVENAGLLARRQAEKAMFG